MNFDITSLEQLKELYGKPNSNSLKKQSPKLTDTYRQWLEQSCFFILASASRRAVDCTPRGDALGQAFSILDDKNLLIPDRRGNNRLDTLSNIVENPKVALLFFIPGIEQTLRVLGQATITTDPELLRKFIDTNSISDKSEATDNSNSIETTNRAKSSDLPICCINISIDAVFFQNARAMARSELWADSSKRRLDNVPSPSDMLDELYKTLY